MKLIINVDGGARGNPGPGGSGVVIRDADETLWFEGGFFLGRVTNNQAEYSGLLKALQFAGRLNPDEIQIYSDSELLVKQIRGDYRVKNEGLKVLYDDAVSALGKFKKWRIDHVRREANREADKLANAAMDASSDVIRTALPGA
ncbi:MAG TPA: ribonuclease HI family protein [Phycisphaerae bacterium]|nr:ribonuclease HI family protein [Phycisphaerae bacterium]